VCSASPDWRSELSVSPKLSPVSSPCSGPHSFFSGGCSIPSFYAFQPHSPPCLVFARNNSSPPLASFFVTPWLRITPELGSYLIAPPRKTGLGFHLLLPLPNSVLSPSQKTTRPDALASHRQSRVIFPRGVHPRAAKLPIFGPLLFPVSSLYPYPFFRSIASNLCRPCCSFSCTITVSDVKLPLIFPQCKNNVGS